MPIANRMTCWGPFYIFSYEISLCLNIRFRFDKPRILRKVIHSFSRSFSSDSSSGEIRQNEKDRSVTRLYRGILDSDWSMGRPMKREEANVKFLSCIRILLLTQIWF